MSQASFGNGASFREPSAFSWSPVLCGMLAALTAHFLFNLLGASIGLALFAPKSEVMRPLGIGAIIWFFLSTAVSLYVGSWIAGRLSNARSTVNAAIYGLTVAGGTALSSTLLALTISGAVVVSSFSLLANLVSFSASAVSSSGALVKKGLKEIEHISPALSQKLKEKVPDLSATVKKIDQKAAELIRNQTEDGNLPEIKAQLEKLVYAYLEADERGYEEARSELSERLEQVGDEKPQQIEKKMEEWRSTYLKAKEKMARTANEASDKVTDALSKIALLNFFMLVIALGVSVMGAIQGADSKDEVY